MEILAQFHKWLLDGGRKPATCANYMAATKGYLKWMLARDRLNPSFNWDKAFNIWYTARGGGFYRARAGVRKPNPKLPLIISYYDSIPLPAADQPRGRLERLTILRARAIVHTLYASAGRATEVSYLTREQVADGQYSQFLITGKGSKDREMLLTPEAQRAIAAYCQERGDDGNPYLFISHGRGAGKRLGRGTIWAIVKRAAKALRLKHGVSPHAFRHFRAQQLLDDGMNIEVLQAYLGHASVDLTRRVYAPETSTRKIRDQLERFGKSASEAVNEIK